MNESRTADPGGGMDRLPDAPASILVLDPCPMEEAVLSTPAYAAVTRRFPGSRKGLLTLQENALLFRGDPNFAGVFGINEVTSAGDWLSRATLRLIGALRHERFDLAIDLAGGADLGLFTRLLGIPERTAISADPAVRAAWKKEPALRRMERKMAFLDRLGCPSRRRRPILIPSRGDERYVADLLAATGLAARERFLVLAPAPSWRSILPPETLAVAINGLANAEAGLAVIFAGNLEMQDYVNRAVSACMNRPSVFYLSPNRFAAFAAMCELIVGAEGIQSLLAAAVGTRTVGIFGGEAAPSHPVEPEVLLRFLIEQLREARTRRRTEERRRYYESEEFRRTHEDANLFLHTAP